MQKSRFRELVATAIQSIPDEFLRRMENVEIIERERPTEDELRSAGLDSTDLLLGLYQGQPLTVRDSYYGNTLPDRILIYQEPIEAICHNDDAIVRQVRKTVLHEIAHHFGIDDKRLHELGLG